MIQADYGITVKPITSRNPQDYSISKRVHQIRDNIISIFKVQEMVLDDESPWDGILTSTMFALHATVHTTTTRQHIKKCKQDLINQQENHNQKEYWYNKGDEVLL